MRGGMQFLPEVLRLRLPRSRSWTSPSRITGGYSDEYHEYCYGVLSFYATSTGEPSGLLKCLCFEWNDVCGQVIANDSVLRSSTVDTTSAEALPELGIPQLIESGLHSECRHAGSVRRRPLTCSRPVRRPPDARKSVDVTASLVSEAGASPCSDQCFRCDDKVNVKTTCKWSPVDEVSWSVRWS